MIVGAFFSGLSNVILKIKHFARDFGEELAIILECGSWEAYMSSVFLSSNISSIRRRPLSSILWFLWMWNVFSLMTSSHSTVILSPYRQNLIQRSPSEVKNILKKSPSSAFEKHLHPALGQSIPENFKSDLFPELARQRKGGYVSYFRASTFSSMFIRVKIKKLSRRYQ